MVSFFALFDIVFSIIWILYVNYILKIAIIGGGAAGFFAAIHAKENYPDAQVVILEKTSKILAKVKVSGGGRCNVTNASRSIKELTSAYPRGGKQMKKLLSSFSTGETIDWFESRGVPLMVQADQCVFPVSQDSQSVIDCLLGECKRLGVEILFRHAVKVVERIDTGIRLGFGKAEIDDLTVDKVIVATGGSPKRSGLEWLEAIGHKLVDPVPSLFTLNMPDESIRSLMGVVVDPAVVSIQGTKLRGSGPLLITHWGMSGPAVLKLSAFGARILAGLGYACIAQVNWVNVKNNEEVAEHLWSLVRKHPKKQLSNLKPYDLPERLWLFMLGRCGLAEDKIWADLGKKGIHKLVKVLTNDEYHVRGKTTFKEEFVTCGGVSWESINAMTMESLVFPGMYFTGEVMDIDGITGGYNFQAAWTTAYFAGKLLSG